MKDALHIREEYEVLYGFFTEVSSPKRLRGPYSGVAITGHPRDRSVAASLYFAGESSYGNV